MIETYSLLFVECSICIDNNFFVKIINNNSAADITDCIFLLV